MGFDPFEEEGVGRQGRCAGLVWDRGVAAVHARVNGLGHFVFGAEESGAWRLGVELQRAGQRGGEARDLATAADNRCSGLERQRTSRRSGHWIGSA